MPRRVLGAHWTLWVALGLALDQDPLHWAWAGSLTSLAITLVVTLAG